MASYDVQRLYEETYKVPFNWEKFLPKSVFNFHSLFFQEFNAPVDLQMATLLPFISSCCGPQTKGWFLTRPSVLNLFWISVAVSGAGKSQTRKRLISEPMQYILKNTSEEISDFEVSRYTRAGKY